MNRAIQQQILRLEREQVRAVNDGDVRSAMRLFDPTFVGFSSTKHKRIRGLRALAATFEYYLKQGSKITYQIAEPLVQARDGNAVATFYWSVRFGRGREIRGRGTHVFVLKGRDWRVVHEHFSRAH